MSDVIVSYTGFSHIMALRSDSSLWTWGMNLQGQLGIGDNMIFNSAYPVNIKESIMLPVK